MPANPGYIVVEGPIGVGKTSLVQRLARSMQAEPVLEQPEHNPFLERFYRDPRNAALPTQLCFLFQRARQLQEIRQGDIFQPARVADFMLEKDRLFAQLNLDPDELRLYDQVYEHLAIDAPKPDLVIYLQAPVEVLRSRVAKRGVGYEQLMTMDYLGRLSDAYTQYFYHYNAAPLLIVNVAEIDLVNNDHDYALLLDYISKPRSGRQYFNPAL